MLTAPPDCCPRCGKLEHTSPFDDPMPPAPAVEVAGEMYLHLPLVMEALDGEGRRAVEHVTGYDIALGNLRRRVQELREQFEKAPPAQRPRLHDVIFGSAQRVAA